MSQTHSYRVRGMTCEHCTRAVTTEFKALDTVTGVTVDLVPHGDSSVTVTSSVELPQDVVREAVQRAGYELVGVPTR